ncbi:MAG: glycosyltransferase family 2 protein [Elusimicrobia bacterium]|nr:glycosyltransferase family 2 protein [Elusimicrobiota bacterium]
MKLSIVIPVYNERATISKVLERVRAVKLPVEREIVVVDDGSTDGTREWLKDGAGDARVILHERNRGKGAAVRTGIAEAKGDFLIIQDADLEYDPAEYPQLLAPMVDGRADVVFGSRFLGGPHRVLLFWHYFGNKLFTLLTNLLYNINLNDMGTGYKLFRTETLRSFPLRADGFGFEPEVTAKVAKRHLRMYEVPISYSGRTYAEGKKITWVDGLVYFWCLVRYRFAD